MKPDKQYTYPAMTLSSMVQVKAVTAAPSGSGSVYLTSDHVVSDGFVNWTVSPSNRPRGSKG